MLPFYPFRSGALDELYPSFQNLKAVFCHLVLIIAQGLFLILLIPSIFLGVPVPLFGFTPTCLLTTVVFVAVNNLFCVLLNGKKRRYKSFVNPSWEQHDDEKWIFINGVAVGDHWMQSNLDRLALTFHREIHGIHNKTRGIIFDVIETIVQRTFGYATPDVREIFADVSCFIEADGNQIARYKKIVLVLHSQGAVEGGLVLDWLFASVSRELLEKVEIYTFGSAANHFNSPETKEGKRVCKHIEHYANLEDYVSLFGILHFRPLPRYSRYQNAKVRAEIENRYVGRLFVRRGSGHQMNGNYLDDFFAMNMNTEGKLTSVKENNDVMDGELNEQLFQDYDIVSNVTEKDMWDCGSVKNGVVDTNTGQARRIKSVSRLWCYRNGMSPKD